MAPLPIIILFVTVRQIYTVKEVAKELQEDERLIRAIAKYILNLQLGNTFFITRHSINKIRDIIKFGRNKIHEL